MAQVTVGDTATQLDTTGTALIQNLGPGALYVSTSSAVTVDNGVQVPPGKAITIGAGPSKMWAVSSGTSDVRTQWAGTGLHAAIAEV